MHEPTTKATAVFQPAESKALLVINRAVCAIAFTATLFAVTSAGALTSPLQTESQAYQGQLENIADYQTLEFTMRDDRVVAEDILEVAGLEINESDARLVQGALRDDLLKALCTTIMSTDVRLYRAWHCQLDLL